MELNAACTRSEAKRKDITNVIYYNYREKGYMANKCSKKGINLKTNQDKRTKRDNNPQRLNATRETQANHTAVVWTACYNDIC